MSDLTDFLLARITEDEEEARSYRDELNDHPPSVYDMGQVGWIEAGSPERVLAECEAKRRIVERHALIASGNGETVELAFHEQGLFEALHFIALPYADHEDYDESWRP